MQGKIIKILSNDYTVLVNETKYICKARGKFRNENITPLVGDNVVVDIEKRYILEVLPRNNYLKRPPVSNIDQLIIIASVKKPNFDTNLLDKFLAIAEFNRILPIICLTKLDLLDDIELEDINKYADYYRNIGYTVIFNSKIEEIKEILKNKISVFTGQSGAGKSTLLNKLDIRLNIKTDEISHALGRGKHTTRHSELLEMNGGFVADTPGFSALEFIDMTESDIRDNFMEFDAVRDNCKYKDCMHKNEDDCFIKEEVEKGNILRSRYDNYLSFIAKR